MLKLIEILIIVEYVLMPQYKPVFVAIIPNLLLQKHFDLDLALMQG